MAQETPMPLDGLPRVEEPSQEETHQDPQPMETNNPQHPWATPDGCPRW